jgi:hypothetical protein
VNGQEAATSTAEAVRGVRRSGSAGPHPAGRQNDHGGLSSLQGQREGLSDEEYESALAELAEYERHIASLRPASGES